MFTVLNSEAIISGYVATQANQIARRLAANRQNDAATRTVA